MNKQTYRSHYSRPKKDNAPAPIVDVSYINSKAEASKHWWLVPVGDGRFKVTNPESERYKEIVTCVDIAQTFGGVW